MAATDPSVKTRRWRRVEYDQLVELGIFTGERLELLHPPATVIPLAAPHARIAVADLLP